MDDKSEKDAAIEETAEFITELADKNGVACATVKDGHVLLFKRKTLRELIEKFPDKETIAIFVKRAAYDN